MYMNNVHVEHISLKLFCPTHNFDSLVAAVQGLLPA